MNEWCMRYSVSVRPREPTSPLLRDIRGTHPVGSSGAKERQLNGGYFLPCFHSPKLIVDQLSAMVRTSKMFLELAQHRRFEGFGFDEKSSKQVWRAASNIGGADLE